MLTAASCTPDVLGKPLGTRGTDLTGYDYARVAAEGDGLPSRSGTGIVQDCAGRYVGKPRKECLSRVLHDEVALPEARKVGRPGEIRHQPGGVRGELYFDSACPPSACERVQILARCLKDQAGTSVIPPK
jgi:hypothetical protein